MELATQDDGVLLYRGNSKPEFVYDLMGQAGMTWLRLNVYSSWVGAHGFADLDRVVDEARARGIHVQLTISGRPRWEMEGGKGAYGVPHIDPDPMAFAIFTSQVVEHFRARVHRYSIWNEPNYPAFLGSDKGRHTADIYAELYAAGYGTIRKVQPKAEVLWGELAGAQGSFSWMKRALRKGGVKATGVAVHPYQYQLPPGQKKVGDYLQFGHLPELKAWLGTTSLIRRPGRTPCGIYITEFGWFADGRPRSIPEATRAKWCADSIRMARKLGVKQYLYYTMIHSPASASWDTGMVASGGTPDPTYEAFRKESLRT